MSSISISVLRKNTDPFPDRESCETGDIVVMASGDVMVWTGSMWDLLPGRYASVEELKVFLSYVASGWPDDPETARVDLTGRVPEIFLERMVETVSRIRRTPGTDAPG